MNEPLPLESFRERLRVFAARRIRDWAAAEDVAQEAIRRTLEALEAGRVKNPDALPGFLFQTALHVCQRYARSAGREHRALGRFAASPGAPPEDPLSTLVSEERRGQVRAALERLEESDREVLSLTYVEGLGATDIARRLDTTPGNVRVRRHRALNRLAELLGVTERGKREHKQ